MSGLGYNYLHSVRYSNSKTDGTPVELARGDRTSSSRGTCFELARHGSGVSVRRARRWGGRVCFEILVIYLYLLSPSPSHLSRQDKDKCLKSVSKSSHLSRHDMIFGPTGENFRSARCARGKKAHCCIFLHCNVTKSIQNRRKYHKSGKKCRHVLRPNRPK